MDSLIRTQLQVGRPDLWVYILAVVFAGAVLWHFLALRARYSFGICLLLTTLRASALALIIFFLLGPSLLRQRLEQFRPTVAIAIDASESMGLAGGLDHNRWERVLSFLEQPLFQQLQDDYFFDYFTFSDTAYHVTAEELGNLHPDGHTTDLKGSLASILDTASAALGAVIVFTDGGHEEPGPEEADRRSATHGEETPVLFLAVGGGESFQDLEVSKARSAGLAFAGQKALVTVEVSSRGFEGRELPLLLKKEEQLILSRMISFTENEESRTVSLEWVPPRPGSYHLSVEIPPQAEEHIKDNNRRDMTVDVTRDKTRVLLLSGRPNWNYRFLREALKGDPSVDLVSFIILRTATDAVDVPQQELSLIPFPTKKIFLEELSNFDLLIFDNFSYQPYLPAEYLERVRSFVEQGGGFWMLGGPLAFAAGGYQGNPIEEILPITLRPVAQGGGYLAKPFRARLTATGQRHPFFQGLGDISPEELPLFEGYNDSASMKEGAIVLLDHPFAEGGEQPVFVVRRYGEGRTLAILTDSLWKWNFELAGLGKGNRFYLTLVRQAVRWSIGDPQLQPLKIELENDHLTPGQVVRARLKVLGENYLPATDPSVQVTLLSGKKAVRQLPVRMEAPGLFLAETEITAPGTFELAASVSVNGEEYGRDSAVLSAQWPVTEHRNPGLNQEALRELGERFPGSLLDIENQERAVQQLRTALAEAAPEYRIDFEEKRGLWELFGVAGLLMGLFCTEWAVRKRIGLD